MKTYFLSLILLYGLYFPKQTFDNLIKQKSGTDSVLVILKNKKAAIDQYINMHSKALIIMVKVPGKNTLVQVKNDNWPDEIEYTYNMLKSQSGKIIFIAQIPYSESGDWNIIYKHYFDEQGNTYAFSKEESIFNDDVKGGVVREMLLNYYDGKFKNISQVNKLTDKDYRAIKRNKSDYDFRDYKYIIYKNIGDCLTGYHLQLSY